MAHRCPVLLQKGTLWFVDKKRCLLCEPLVGLWGWCRPSSWTCPLAPRCADQAARRFEPAAVAASPAQPSPAGRADPALGALEPKNNSNIVATSPSPRLSQLLIKDVGGPNPGTQYACPSIKPQTRSDSGPAGGGDEFISWLFRQPNSHGLGAEDGSMGGHAGGSLQRPPPKGNDDNILSPRRGRGARQMGGSGVGDSRLSEVPVNRPACCPLAGTSSVSSSEGLP